MAKRFIDNDFYKERFYKQMPSAYKLLWIQLFFGDCDHAGIWIVEEDVAQTRNGKDAKVDFKKALEYFNDGKVRVLPFDNGEKWLFVDFVTYQYIRLNKDNRAHNSVIERLKPLADRGLIDISDGTIKVTGSDEYNNENEYPTVESEDVVEHNDGDINYNSLMDYFNNTFRGKLQTIGSMTPNRKKVVKARIKQYGKDGVMEVFRLVLQSPFLNGDNDRGWKANFDWIFKQENFTKIMEGNYNGKRIDSNTERRESVNRLKDIAAAILQGAETSQD